MINAQIQEVAKQIRESENPVRDLLSIIELSINRKTWLRDIAKELVEWL